MFVNFNVSVSVISRVRVTHFHRENITMVNAVSFIEVICIFICFTE